MYINMRNITMPGILSTWFISNIIIIIIMLILLIIPGINLIGLPLMIFIFIIVNVLFIIWTIINTINKAEELSNKKKP